jgi:hypothetical protein
MRELFVAAPIAIEFTGGSITEFAEFANLRNVTPEGWPAGTTWSTVPGTASSRAVFLGDSGKSNNAYSLAIHESTHAVDLNVSLTATSAKLRALFEYDKAHDGRTDLLTVYRLSLIREYLAVGVDEYSCNTKTRRALQRHYPRLFAYIENDFASEVRERSSMRGGDDRTSCKYTCAAYRYAEGECRSWYMCTNGCLVSSTCP